MNFLINLGYLGLFIGAFISSTIIPFSSDALLVGMLSLGYNVWICLIVATIGNWCGGLTSYAIGYAGNLERIEKKFKLNLAKLEKIKDKINKYGTLIAFFAWLPIIGDLLSVGLGFYKTNKYKVAAWMFIGRFVRFLFWSLLYFYFADDFINFISNKLL